MVTPIRLQTQASTEDVDQPSPLPLVIPIVFSIVFQKQSGKESNKPLPEDQLMVTPIRLQTQASTEDVDQPSPLPLVIPIVFSIVFQKQSGKESNKPLPEDQLMVTPIRLQTQASTEDVDQPSPLPLVIPIVFSIVFQKQSGKESNKPLPEDQLMVTPIRLQTQASTEDVDQPSPLPLVIPIVFSIVFQKQSGKESNKPLPEDQLMVTPILRRPRPPQRTWTSPLLYP